MQRIRAHEISGDAPAGHVAWSGVAFFGLACALGAPIAQADPARPQMATLYVANEGQADGTGSSVTAIDAGSLKVTATIGLGTTGPVFPAASPDGKSLWVAQYVYDYTNNTCLGSAVSVISLLTLQVTATVALPPCPNTVVFSSDGRLAYVPGAPGPISVITTQTPAEIGTIAAGTGQNDLALGQDGRWLYAADATDPNITIIDTKSNLPVRQIGLDADPVSLAITPDGRFLFAWVLVPYATDLVNIEQIDLRTNTVVARIGPPVGSNAHAMAVAPDGRVLYDVDFYAQTVWEFSTRGRRRVGGIAPLNLPIGIGLSQDGRFAYVTDNNCASFPCANPGFVSVVDTRTQQVKATVNVGINPQYIAVVPQHPRQGEKP